MRIAYIATDAAGARVKGELDVPGMTEAAEELLKKGLYASWMGEATGAPKADRSNSSKSGGVKVKAKELATFTRQLSVLTSSGTPMVQAMAAVERQLPPSPWRVVVETVRANVEQGVALSQALGAHPRCFDAVYRSLVAAGESGGQLTAMLASLSETTRKRQKIQATLRGMMMYPVMLVALSIVVVVVMLTVVLPKFAGLFDTLGAEVPWTTRALMVLSGALTEYWWAFAGGAVALAVGAAWAITSGLARDFLGTFILRAPVLGKFMRGIITARITRTLGVLLESKVPLIEALDLTREAADNPEYAALIERAKDAVMRGEAISGAFRASPLISISAYEAFVTGEESGKLGAVLLNIAEFMDEDNETMTKAVSSLVEPLILIILGAVVGFVAISMFLPLFDLTSAASSSGGGGGGAP